MAQPQVTRGTIPALELPGVSKRDAPVPASLRPPRTERLQEIWFSLKQNPTALGGFALIGLLVLCALFAPWLAPYDPKAIDMNAIFQSGPTWHHPFGTD